MAAAKPKAQRLRAVNADEKPAKPKSLAEAIDSGDYLEILRAQRREMVVDVREERGPAKAAMHRQIALLSKEIAKLESTETDDDLGKAAATADESFDSSAI